MSCAFWVGGAYCLSPLSVTATLANHGASVSLCVCVVVADITRHHLKKFLLSIMILYFERSPLVAIGNDLDITPRGVLVPTQGWSPPYPVRNS